MYRIETRNYRTTSLIYKPVLQQRVQSIDLLRGIVMIVMALDHVRDYFHKDAFLYAPENLSQTNVLLFFTRWSTHFCAPVFVFLAGVAACLYGEKKGLEALSFFLLTRGLWLVLAELFIVTLEWTFNVQYPLFNLQVIWATGISMMVLAAFIYLPRWLLLTIGIALTAAHNLLDNIHVNGNGPIAFVWSLLHDPGYFAFHNISFSVRYPVLPWIGIMLIGYASGSMYLPQYNPKKRQQVLLIAGLAALCAFLLLRTVNAYGDPAPWMWQKNALFSLLSFLNVTKYPPSLLYVLMTLGPALVFLSVSERPLPRWALNLTVMGRVPMFYYLLHLFFIHALAMIAAVLSGYHLADMILSTRVNASTALKGYGFNLFVVYMVWISIILLLYPLCKKFDGYKRKFQAQQWWLRYL